MTPEANKRRAIRPLTLHIFFAVLVFYFAMAAPALAAISCELNYPTSDVVRLFPDSTSYKSVYFSFSQRGGDTMLHKVEARLGGAPALYAPLNVPYVLYEVYKGNRKVGYVHGVNQKGQFGVLEVFVSLDMKGTIKAFYIQRISGSWGRKFTSPKFGRQFVGLSLKDFERYDTSSGKGSGKVAAIVNPAPEAQTDFFGVLRAIKKNLVLMDEFFYAPEKGKQ